MLTRSTVFFEQDHAHHVHTQWSKHFESVAHIPIVSEALGHLKDKQHADDFLDERKNTMLGAGAADDLESGSTIPAAGTSSKLSKIVENEDEEGSFGGGADDPEKDMSTSGLYKSVLVSSGSALGDVGDSFVGDPAGRSARPTAISAASSAGSMVSSVQAKRPAKKQMASVRFQAPRRG